MTPLEIFLAILSACSMAAAIVFGLRSEKRNTKKDYQGDESRLTRIESKVDYVVTTVNEIKGDQRDQREELSDMNTRVTRVEESVRLAHKRIDEINTKTA